MALNEVIRRFSAWLGYVLLQQRNGMPSGNTGERATRSYTEQGIAAAIARVKAGKGIAVGAKVGRIDGDVIGLLVSVEGKFGYVRFDPDPKAQPQKLKMNEIFNVELANMLAHAYRSADLQKT